MSTTFWNAFLTGLACPTQLFTQAPANKYKQIGRVDAAWTKAGGYIYQAKDAFSKQLEDRSGDRRKK
jgi:hypothetical protein